MCAKRNQEDEEEDQESQNDASELGPLVEALEEQEKDYKDLGVLSHDDAARFQQEDEALDVAGEREAGRDLLDLPGCGDYTPKQAQFATPKWSVGSLYDYDERNAKSSMGSIGSLFDSE